MLADAKREVSEKTKAFEASRAPKAVESPAPPVTRNPADVTPAKPQSVTAPAAEVGDQLDLSGEMTALAGLLGPDGVKSIEAALRKIESRNQAALLKSRSELQQVTQAQAQIAQATERSRIERLETEADVARAELAKSLPIIATDNDQWEELKREAWALHLALGGKTEWKQSVIRMGRAKFQEDIQVEAQRQLAKKGSKSLRGSIEPAGKVAAPARQMDKAEKSRAVFDLLEQGKSAEEARQVVYGA